MQVASQDPFLPFAAHASDQPGPFFTVSRSANSLRGVFFIVAWSANCLRGVFFIVARPANPEQRSPLPPCTSCRAIAGGLSPHSPTLPTAGNQLFPFILYPDYSNPLPSVKGKSPENPKKAPFLLFPRHPHCQNPSIPPAWTQGGLATATMPQGEKQESRP